MKAFTTGKKTNRYASILSIFVLLFVLLGTVNTFAAESTKEMEAQSENTGVENVAIEVLSYDYKAEVEKSHTYKVIEKISVNIPDDAKSISFVIPNGNFRVSGIKVENAEYQTDKKSELRKVTILDSEKLTAGVHVYTIEYTIMEWADRDENKDVFYLDAMLPGWEYPVSHVNIKVTFPEDFPIESVKCFAGQYGVQSVSNKVDYKINKNKIKISADKIPENFGISLLAELPNNYWQGAMDGSWAAKATLAIMLLVSLLLLILWVIGGRDPKFDKMFQDHPLEGITPAEVGYIFTGRIHTRDLIALVIYMGTKGYLKISEYRPKKYCLIRKNYPTGEEKYIRTAYDVLFEGVDENREVDMDELGPRLRRVRNVISEDVAAGFSDKEMAAYKPLSKAFRGISAILYGLALGAACALRFSYQYLAIEYAEAIIVAILAVATSVFMCRQFNKQYYSVSKAYRRSIAASVALFVAVPIYVAVRVYNTTGKLTLALGIVILSLLCGFLIGIMRARGKGNAELSERFMALRHFIYHPTPKEIAQNYFEDKNYYYDIVPYALQFDGLETWAITFLTLDVPEPEWYSDDIEGHAHSNIRTEPSTVDYARDIKAFYRTMIDAYHVMVRTHRKG